VLDSTKNPSFKAWYALVAVIIATFFGMVDRQILVLVTDPIERDMHITDVQIGVLQGIGPGLLAAVGMIALGWLADRTARQNILAVCIVLWSFATAACGMAQNFHQLLFACVAIALGEAAIAPVFYSMVPDLFPGKSRLTANLVYFGAVTIGAGLGVALSGAVIGAVTAHRANLPAPLATTATWRIAFFVVAAPGVLIATLVALIGSIARQSPKETLTASNGVLAYYRGHWRTAGGVYVSGGLYALVYYATMVWTPVMVMRILGAPPAEVGLGIGAAFSIGSIVGVFLAGSVAKVLRSKFGIMTPMRIFQGSLLLTTVPLVLLLTATQPWQVYVLAGVQMAVATTGTALTPTMLQDIAPGRIRGQLIAIYTLFYSLIASISPVLVGAVSDALARYPRGLLWALVIVPVPCLIFAVLILALIDRHFRRTIGAFAPA
jgi:MFS family permease